jgi:hypothetical protein
VRIKPSLAQHSGSRARFTDRQRHFNFFSPTSARARVRLKKLSIGNDITVCLDVGSFHLWIARHLYKGVTEEVLLAEQMTIRLARDHGFADSPLEESGFEFSVPPEIGHPLGAFFRFSPRIRMFKEIRGRGERLAGAV